MYQAHTLPKFVATHKLSYSLSVLVLKLSPQMYGSNDGKAEHVCIKIDSSWQAADKAALDISVTLGVQQQLFLPNFRRGHVSTLDSTLYIYRSCTMQQAMLSRPPGLQAHALSHVILCIGTSPHPSWDPHMKMASRPLKPLLSSFRYSA